MAQVDGSLTQPADNYIVNCMAQANEIAAQHLNTC